jgi:hypothetical protein
LTSSHPGCPSYHVWGQLSTYLRVCGWTTAELTQDLAELTAHTNAAPQIIMPVSTSEH